MNKLKGAFAKSLNDESPYKYGKLYEHHSVKKMRIIHGRYKHYLRNVNQQVIDEMKQTFNKSKSLDLPDDFVCSTDLDDPRARNQRMKELEFMKF